jgi:hypothetical protein
MHNGVAPTEVQLPPGALRRLARLHARTEGAQQAAQAASNTLQVLQQALREALTEACEEEGTSVGAAQTQVDIDWRTGVVSFGAPQAPAPQGEPLPAGPAF